MPNSSKQLENPFSDGANAYSKFRPSYPMSLADTLARMCSSRSLALDAGCGTGQLSCQLADKFSHIIAVDSSQDQINEATHHASIDYRCESANQTSVLSNSVDLIVAAQAAHWFELQSFYQEARRVGAQDCVIALISYGVLSVDDELDRIFQRFYWKTIHQHWSLKRRHVETGYTEFNFPFDEIEIPTIFIEHDWNLAQFIGYIKTWSAVKNAKREGLYSLVENFEIEISDAWQNPYQTRRINWPIVGRLGRM